MTRQLPVKVVTRNRAEPEKVAEKSINFLDSNDRKWLSKHCWWAMHNNHSVTTYAES